MGREIHVKVEGLENVKAMLKSVGIEFTGKMAGYMLQAAGRESVKQMRREVPFDGKIKRLYKKDLYASSPKGSNENPFVLVGNRFGEMVVNEKVAVIAQHMTKGFNQTNRQGRGHVKEQLENPVVNGWKHSENARNASIGKSVKTKVAKVRVKHRGVLA